MILDPSIEWTGGGFAATPLDLARWARFFYGGQALTTPYLDTLVASGNPHTPRDAGYRYGMGVQIVEDETLGLRLVHGGYFFGYSSYMEYLPEADMALAFQINTKRGFAEYRGYADQLWRVVLGGLDPRSVAPATPRAAAPVED